MKRKQCLALALAALTLCASLTGVCGAASLPQPTADPLETASVGVLTGSTGGNFMSAAYPNAKQSNFPSTPDAFTALAGHKVDYIVTDSTNCKAAVRLNPKLAICRENLSDQPLGMAVIKGNTELLEQLNGVLEQYKADGTLEEIMARWHEVDGNYAPVDVPVSEGKNGTLKVGMSGDVEPYSFLLNGKYNGSDCELMERIAYDLDMKLEYQVMQFSGLLSALAAGKVDMLCAAMGITEERKQSVDFTISYANDPLTAVCRVEDLPASTQPTDADAPQYATLADISGKLVAAQTGGIFDILVNSAVPNMTFSYFNTHTDELMALQNGKVEGVPLDAPIAQLAVANNPDLTILPERVVADSYGVALQKDSPLTPPVNEAIAQLAADGTLEAMKAKWTGSDGSAKVLPDLDYPGTAGTLRVAHDVTGEPMEYMGANGQALGFDLELMLRIGQILDYKIEFVVTDFASLIATLESGKADAAVGCLSISDERKEKVDMSESYYDAGIYFVVRKLASDVPATAEVGFWEGLKQSFTRTFITENRWKLVLDGLGVTVLISICSGILGTAAGFGICMLRRSRNRLISVPTAAFIRLIQGTPIVVMLMILYYIIFGKVDISAILVSILGFAINFGVYVSEMMRTGIDAVDKGQIEAAHALGFNKVKTFWKITFPQAARHFLPVFKGEFISMVKMTSVVGYIAIQDLTKVSDIIRSRTLEAFFPLIATAVIYFLVANVMTMLLSHLEVRLDPKRRKRAVKGVVVK